MARPRIEAPASIRKQDIAKCAAMVGQRNSKPMGDAPKGTYAYAGFHGAINLTTKLYDGVHVFIDAGSSQEKQTDFGTLPGMKGAFDASND